MIPGVPYDAEIEYLESTGTQWIDSGISAKSTYTISITVSLSSYNSWSCLWSARNIVSGAPKYTFTLFENINHTQGRFDFGSSQIAKNFNFSDWESKHTYRAESNKLYIDNTLYCTATASPEFTTGGNVWLLASEATNLPGQITNFLKGKIYSAKIIDNNGNAIRDLIPVRVGQTGYMYDRVTRRLFGNKGTGSFVLGPDVAKPVMGLWGFKSLTAKDYISNGLVAMWDGIENAGWGKHTESPELFKELVGGQPALVGGQFGSGLTTDPNYEITENGLKSNTVGGNYAIGVGVPFTTNLGNNWTIEWCRYAHSIPILQESVNTIMVYPYVDHNGRIWEYVLADGSTFRQKYSGEWNTRVVESSGSGSTFAITCNPTTRRICYKNGTVGGTNSNSFSFYYSANTTHIGFGTNKIGATLYAFRIYNRALSASEISFNHKIDKARFNLP